MYASTKISREQFLNTHFLKITVADFERSYLHHNRFVFEVITDRSKEMVKKRFSEVKRFSDEIYQKFGMKEFTIENHIRNSKREEQVQNLFKKLNSGYIMTKDNASQTQNQIKVQVRNYLYNLLFSNIEQLPSSEDEDQINNTTIATARNSFIKQKTEDIGKQQRERPRERETMLPNVIRNIFKSKRDSQDFRRRDQLLKNIKSVWMKTEKGWFEKSYELTDDSFILYDKSDLEHRKIILLKFLTPLLLETDYLRIVLFHPSLKKNMEIRVNSLKEASKDERQEYLNLFNGFRDLCERGENAYNFVGIYIRSKKNKFMVEPEKRPAQKLNMKLTHEDEVFSFTMPIDGGTYLQLPILNNFGKYEAEITEQKQSGLIPNLRENNVIFSLPIQNIYDQIYNEKPKRKGIDMKNQILQSKQCNYSIRLEYFDVTTWRSYFAGSLKDRFEGFEEPTQFSREEFRIQKNRIKRILYSIEQWISYVKCLKNCEYPLQSAIFYILLLLTIICFDANNILQYLLATMCIIMVCQHPTSYSYFRDLISLITSAEFTKFMEQHLQERLWQPKFRIAFKKSEQKRKFLSEFNMRKKKKRNILEKYNRLQEILLRGQLYLTEIVTFCEKIKNLFCWYHHQKTKWLFLIFLALFAALFFIPIRVLALLALIKMYLKGRNNHVRIQQLNKVIVFQLMRIIVEEQNLASIREYLQDPLKMFDKRSSEYLTFEKKAKESFSEILQIQFDPAIFTQARCLGELLQWLSECRKRFIISEEVCRKYKFSLEWSKSNSSLKKLLVTVYLFLTNVPSDRSILDTKQEADPESKEDDSEDEQIS